MFFYICSPSRDFKDKARGFWLKILVFFNPQKY